MVKAITRNFRQRRLTCRSCLINILELIIIQFMENLVIQLDIQRVVDPPGFHFDFKYFSICVLCQKVIVYLN